MSKLYNMSFDTTALDPFVNENQPLVTKMIKESTVVKSGIDVNYGNKYDLKLNSNTHNIVLQEDTGCAFNPDASSGMVFGQQLIEVEAIKLDEQYCTSDLEDTWANQVMKAGSNTDDLPFETVIATGISDALQLEIGRLFWRGDKTSGTGNLALVNGMASFLDTKGSVFVNDASGALTKDNAIDKMNALTGAFPEEILERTDLAVYASPADYKAYIDALIASQYPIDNTSQNKPYGKSVLIPGYDIEVIRDSGTATGLMYGSYKENFVIAVDLMSDTENIDIWYSKDNQRHQSVTKFKMGVGTHFPEFVVHNNPNIA